MNAQDEAREELARKHVRNAVNLAARYQLTPDVADEITDAVIANLETVARAAGRRLVDEDDET